ncbi:histone acetyltransferase catalytic subunit of the native multisubunit complex [Nadsonia fulvescens var. elongata DSM 6958]|uniref:Histone acetyltransferase ESA1 n=1 Tax=Nadsonia fulvescens var. elongata DSM 6958 TaxID=857566 RepID=A0A1E3PD09_9ASCO|nr:histone acetyltransferase catalytic subunit of the native multisubunit complex [Nadsonia fulvescens var. elongata DSM 6958]
MAATPEVEKGKSDKESKKEEEKTHTLEIPAGILEPNQKLEAKHIRIGCKCFVAKDDELRLAEILSVHTRKGKLVFYVHYKEFNKRLDEWVDANRLDLTQQVEWPRDRVVKKAVSVVNKIKHGKKRGRTASSQTPAVEGRSTPTGGDVMDLDNLNVNGQENSTEDYNREEEIEKLRTSGSMSQGGSHEVSRVRNLHSIILGGYQVEPWYFSPYPIELSEEDTIYICDFSLCFFGSKKQFERFRSKCTLKHPPGNEIYRDDKVSFFEIDGRRQRTWCRNLCLLSKLFLDHKTLYYDVDPFLFYCMTKRDEKGHHLVGYFSKEKESAENYNVACILTLPQYQRHGYGKMLIQFSYELSKKEGKVGSPEKPLSDLGLMSYRAYWADTIIELLMESGKTEMTIEDISSATAMTTTDILHTLQTMNMLKYYKGQHIICITDAVVVRHDKIKTKKRHYLEAHRLQWKPPVFTAAQLRFGW